MDETKQMTFDFSLMKDSPALTDPSELDRLGFLPIRHPTLDVFFKKQEQSLWSAEEIYMVDDVRDWKQGLEKNPKQDEIAKRYLTYVMVFFYAADTLVASNLETHLSKVTMMEARFFYDLQKHVENVHNRAYSNMLDALLGRNMVNQVSDNLSTFQSVQNKIQWVKKWIDAKELPVQVSVVAFAIVESIFFSSLFAAIYRFKRGGKLHSLASFNYMIARDEKMHYDFACELYKMVESECRVPTEQFHAMLREAVQVDIAFHEEALNGETLGGFPLSDIILHDQHIANMLCRDMNYPKLYPQVHNTPFTWIETMNMDRKGNFFEVPITEYSHHLASSKKKVSFVSTDVPTRPPLLHLDEDF